MPTMDAPFGTPRAVLLAPVLGLVRALRLDPARVELLLFERSDGTMLAQALFPINDARCHMCDHWCQAPFRDNRMLWMSCGATGKPYVYRRCQLFNVCAPNKTDALHTDHVAPVMVCGDACMDRLRRYLPRLRRECTHYEAPTDLLRRLLRRNILRERVRRWRASRAITAVVYALRSEPRFRMCRRRLLTEFAEMCC